MIMRARWRTICMRSDERLRGEHPGGNGLWETRKQRLDIHASNDRVHLLTCVISELSSRDATALADWLISQSIRFAPTTAYARPCIVTCDKSATCSSRPVVVRRRIKHRTWKNKIRSKERDFNLAVLCDQRFQVNAVRALGSVIVFHAQGLRKAALFLAINRHGCPIFACNLQLTLLRGGRVFVALGGTPACIARQVAKQCAVLCTSGTWEAQAHAHVSSAATALDGRITAVIAPEGR